MSFEWQEERRELQKRLKDARDAIDEVLETVAWDVYDLCGCGHRRCEHRRVLSPSAVRDACVVDGCLCVDFDDSDVQHRYRERQERNGLRLVGGGERAA